MEDSETIKVYNRKLEQCLFCLGEDWTSCGKENGSTVWEFRRTPEAEWIIEHFNASYNRRNGKQ